MKYILSFFLPFFPVFLMSQGELACGTSPVYAHLDSSEVPWYGNNQILETYLSRNSHLLRESIIQERSSEGCEDMEAALAIPVKFWVWRATTTEIPVTLEDLSSAIKQTNQAFQSNGLNIRLYMLCVDYPVNQDLIDIQDSNELHDLDNDHHLNNAINVHVVNSGLLPNGAPWGGIYTPHGQGYIGIIRTALEGYTLSHELGHFWGLDHPFIHTEDFFKTGTLCCKTEPVTRGNAYFSRCLGCYFLELPVNNKRCERTGDYLCDTPADPSDVDRECLLTGTKNNWEDVYGVQFNPDRTNIMSYYRDNCGNTFTPQQKAIMVENIANGNWQSDDLTLIDPDQYEPDNSNTESPTMIKLGISQCHSMHDSPNDNCGSDQEDWFHIDNQMGMIGSYQIEIEDIPNSPNPVEDITVYYTNNSGDLTGIVPTTFSSYNQKRVWEIPCSAIQQSAYGPKKDFLIVCKRGDNPTGTYKITLNNTVSVPTIKEQSAFCSGQYLTVENLPTGATVTWLHDPEVYLSTTNGPTTQLIHTWVYPCWVAAIVELNGCTYKILRNFTHNGNGSLEPIGPFDIQASGNCAVNFIISVPPVPNATHYEWECTSSNPSFGGCQGYNGASTSASASINNDGYLTFTVNVTAYNDCGQYVSSSITYTHTPIGDCDEWLTNPPTQTALSAQIIPNPVKMNNGFTIQIDGISTEVQLIITNQYGEPKYVGAASQPVTQLPDLLLPNGLYYLHIISPQSTTATIFIVSE